MAKLLRRITLVSTDGSGARTVFKRKRSSKRRVSRWLKPVERRDRAVANAANAFTEQWLKRHKRSTSKRKDGWLRDASRNFIRANTKAYKKLYRI